MMYLREKAVKIINEALEREAEIFVPEHESFGHYSTNVAMKASKEEHKSPLALAEEFIVKIKETDKDNFFSAIKIAGPGFINFKISERALLDGFQKMLAEKKNFGKKQGFSPERIQIEFISANPTGPLTLGNGRGVFGDVLANVFEFCGHKVMKEYYVNDVGNQIKSLGYSVLGNALGEYKGEYIEELKKKIKTKDPERAGKIAVGIILKGIKRSLDRMGIRMDSWFPESVLHRKKKTEKIIARLRNQDLAYEKDGAIWFRSSLFGDDKDRVIVKSDGEFTYFANDFAYLQNKFNERKFDRVINIWGADHHGDVARVLAAAEVLGYKGRLEIILMQFVRLMQDGKEIRMSKRKGVYYTVDELLDEVGRDAFRFFFLMSPPDSHIDFNLALAKEQSLNNPVYYLKYAATRCRSLIKKAGRPDLGADLSPLRSDEDLSLIFTTLRFPEVVRAVALGRSPQLIARYGLDLAKKFNNFYEKERILGAPKNEAKARLALACGALLVWKNIFQILGIELPEKM